MKNYFLLSFIVLELAYIAILILDLLFDNLDVKSWWPVALGFITLINILYVLVAKFIIRQNSVQPFFTISIFLAGTLFIFRIFNILSDMLFYGMYFLSLLTILAIRFKKNEKF